MRLTHLLVLLALLPAAAEVLAGDADLDYAFDWSTGYDSNPLRLADGATGAGFTELEFDVDLEVDLRRHDELYLELEGGALLFTGDATDADENDGLFTIGYKWVPMRDDFRRLAVDGGLEYRLHRETFTSRMTGDVFETDDGGTPAPIPERFDSNRATGFVDVEWRLDNRWRLFFAGAYAAKDYVEDYEALASVESLDYSAITLEPGVRIQLRYDLALKMSALWTDRDYDSRSAQDEAGVLVPGSTREYVYTGFEADLDYRPNAPWRFDGGFNLVNREDTFAGYFDSSSWSVYGATRFLVGARNKLRVYGSLRSRDYNSATVSDEVNGELRSSDTLLLKTSYERTLSRRFDLTVEAGFRDEENVNAVYSYDRQWLAAWVSFE